ncbi:hypothetical protein PTE_01582 [Photorhabdus khanii NC19]|uniref:Uncharacterized protein n=1 Tax=Photorhabdus khanii NC19 TaxID=1004151 RepID=W3VB30_9GAMM|nr:hypothetical protein PTE_01582 [Photorhabdus khanii NC19]
MTFYSFASTPILISVLGCILYIHNHVRKDNISKQIQYLLIFSSFVCLSYPLIGIFIFKSFNIFEDITLFSVISSILSIVINGIILYLYRKLRQ